MLDCFIFSNGGKVLDDNGKCALTSPEAVEALEFYSRWPPTRRQGILNASSGDMRELFLNGSLALEFWPALEQPTLQKSKLDWDFVVGHAPRGQDPDRHLWRLEPGGLPLRRTRRRPGSSSSS